MGRMTYFVALAFEATPRGKLLAGQAWPAGSASEAKRIAERLAKTKTGAVAFSRTGDPDFGEWDTAVVIESYGKVPAVIMDEAA